MNPSNLQTLTLKVDGQAHSLEGTTLNGERTCFAYLITLGPICKIYFMFEGQEKPLSQTLTPEPTLLLEKLQHARHSLADKRNGQQVVSVINRIVNLRKLGEEVTQLRKVSHANS